ncbi:MAG: ABC transporter ATP-binding protein [Gammaproteobacteria bacterium]|nr:ABC transporter ATP-binding protein [Gammaproteobacteria bacterium]
MDHSTKNDHFIKINDLTYAFGDRVVFDKINLQIPRGKITAIMGPSGTGKTTLLKLISAQLKARSGSVLVDGLDVHKLSRPELYALRRRIGVLFQSGALFTNLNVYENVAFPLREHTNLPKEMIHDLVIMKLQAVGLRGARHLKPNQLSGGMSRRVALARCLALDPDLLMYDEPFTGQDPITMGVLVSLIKKINQVLGVTSIIVSHDVAETSSIADYIYILFNGKIIGQGTPQEIASSKSPDVHQFMEGLPDGTVPFHYPGNSYEEDLKL